MKGFLQCRNLNMAFELAEGRAMKQVPESGSLVEQEGGVQGELTSTGVFHLWRCKVSGCASIAKVEVW